MRHREIKRFDSFHDYLQYVEKSPIDGSSHRREEKTDGTFFGTTTFDDALELARNGWPEGAVKYHYSLDNILKNFERPIEQLFYNVSGLILDAGRAATGLPDAFLENQNIFQVKRTIDIVVHVGVMSIVAPEQIINRGAAILALIDNLILADFDVKLTALSAATGQRIDPIITIELPMNPPNIDLLAFILAHPSFHRRLNFGCRELMKDNLMGGDYATDDLNLTEIKELFSPDAFYIGSLKHDQEDFYNFKTSANWVEKNLDKLQAKNLNVITGE
jgi:hypothetical protein